MTLNGNIYFPHQYVGDGCGLPIVPVDLRAVLMHEATQLYPHYALGM